MVLLLLARCMQRGGVLMVLAKMNASPMDLNRPLVDFSIHLLGRGARSLAGKTLPLVSLSLAGPCDGGVFWEVRLKSSLR